MEDAAASEAEVGSISDEPTMEEEDALDGLSEDEAKIELLVVADSDGAEDELLMLLDRPRFKMLALFRTALVPAPRERLEVNAGELLGCSELTGVAIKVGVTSLLVIMVCVVMLRDRLRDKAFCRTRLLGLNKLGRMTGLNVLLDREKVKLELGAGLIIDWSSSSSSEDVAVDSSKSSTELEARMKSSSRSLKSAEAAVEELETKSEDDKLGVTDTELGDNVVSTSPDSNSGTIEVLSSVVSLPPRILLRDSKSPAEGSSVASMPMPTDVGKICKESVTVAANMSVLVSSRLVITVLSPSMEVVQ